MGGGGKTLKNIISARLAGNVLLAAFGSLAVFDVMVMLGILPSDIVWGGQIPEGTGAFWFELVALVVTLFFALIVAARLGYIGAGRFPRATNIGVWIIFAFMVLNTLGNLASGVTIEKLIFAPVTIVLALCALRLALETNIARTAAAGYQQTGKNS